MPDSSTGNSGAEKKERERELDFLSPAYFSSSSKIPGGYLLIYVILIVVLEHL